jgi:hypothetical protein
VSRAFWKGLKGGKAELGSFRLYSREGARPSRVEDGQGRKDSVEEGKMQDEEVKMEEGEENMEEKAIKIEEEEMKMEEKEKEMEMEAEDEMLLIDLQGLESGGREVKKE